MRLIRLALIAFLALGAWSSNFPVIAQPVRPPQGAFARLSPGDQAIARALFEAQKSASLFRPRGPLSLDEIAAKKVGGKRWGDVFKEMKSRGLVDQRSIGQVVSAYNHRHASKTATAGAKRPDDPAGPKRAAASLGADASHLERGKAAGSGGKPRR